MLLGVAERLEYVDAPSHVEDVERYRARGSAMAGNRCAIVTDRPADLVEVHLPAMGRSTVSPRGQTACIAVPAPTGVQ